MSQNSETVAGSRRDHQLYWMIAMVVTYPLGNMLAFNLSHYLAYHGLLLLIPVSFSAVPIIGAMLGIKGKLFRKPYRYPGITLLISLLFILTWLAAVYLLVQKVIPYMDGGL